MGASQSTGGGATPGGSVEVKTSYYELLGVERTATQDDIKKAYRRKALELHPDRNYGDVERTTALFADIQSAYEVLSDEQERAWYDAHEGDILRGGNGEGTTDDHYQGNMRVTTADDLARMMGKFRGKVDFSDSPNGFFGYVRETFEQLAREEEYAADYEGIDIPSYPSFGHKDDNYEDVVRNFYAAWNGFATAKSFAWLDAYRPSDAPDRRFRRAMEKENQKRRDDGRRDFNEAVRTLVAFVRKRDPRYTPNRQSDEDKAKAARDARKAQAARSRAAHLAKLELEAQALPSWATERPADEEEEEDEEEVEEDIYECIACNKTFKSERQYEAHEKSKKHQKAIQSLKKKMQKDNVHLDLDEGTFSSGLMMSAGDDDNTGSEAEDLADSVQDLTGKADKLSMENDHVDKEEEAQSEGSLPDEIAIDPQSLHETSPLKHDEEDDDDSDDDDNDDEYASRSEIEARLASSAVDPSKPSTEMKEPMQAETTIPKLGKAAQKRAKKAAKQAQEEQSGAKNKCLGCEASFPSKSQLHHHLLDHPKHAALKAVSGGGGRKGRKK